MNKQSHNHQIYSQNELFLHSAFFQTHYFHLIRFSICDLKQTKTCYFFSHQSRSIFLLAFEPDYLWRSYHHFQYLLWSLLFSLKILRDWVIFWKKVFQYHDDDPCLYLSIFLLQHLIFLLILLDSFHWSISSQ